MDGQELDAGHAQTGQMLDDRRLGEPREGAAKLERKLGVELGEAAHVKLVEDGPLPWHPRTCGVTPQAARFDHPALRHVARVVPAVERQVSGGAVEPVAEVDRVRLERAVQRLRVRVDQQLVRVESVARTRIVRPVDAIAVEHAGMQVAVVAVPHLVRVLGQRDALQLAPPGLVEQAELHLLRMLGEQREVDAPPIPGRAQRRRPPRLDRPFSLQHLAT